MAIGIQGFVNHMMHKKETNNPRAIAVSDLFCIFTFNTAKELTLAVDEIAAFNQYYNYGMEVDKESLSMVIINNVSQFQDMVKLQREKEEGGNANDKS